MHGAFLTLSSLGADTDFSKARGLLISARSEGIEPATHAMAVVDQALDHGCLVYLSYGSDSVFATLEPHLTTRDHSDIRKLIHGEDESRQLARAMNDHDPGRSRSQFLQIDAGDEAIDTEVDVLLRRAFPDCTAVHLSPLNGGRSSARTYRVQVHSDSSRAGPLLLPYFLKVDDRHHIRAEIDNYHDYGASHIPWHLTPTLDLGRCVSGHSTGLLVAAFVDSSVPLMEAVQRDGHAEAITQLFEVTLAAWRDEARRKDLNAGPPALLFGNVFDPRQAKQEVLQCVAGSSDYLTPAELQDALRALPSVPCLMGTIHGDLHARNVHVRNADAIVIDLAKVRTGPLSTDIAQMETSLVCEAPLPYDDWCDLVERTYSLDALLLPSRPGAYSADRPWLDVCVHRLRELSASRCQSDVEYSVAIALHLAARARHEYIGEGPDGVERRAIAYLAACRIARDLNGRRETHE